MPDQWYLFSKFLASGSKPCFLQFFFIWFLCYIQVHPFFTWNYCYFWGFNLVFASFFQKFPSLHKSKHKHIQKKLFTSKKWWERRECALFFTHSMHTWLVNIMNKQCKDIRRPAGVVVSVVDWNVNVFCSHLVGVREFFFFKKRIE